MLTDIKRMQQIIKNLLSNAFKFTHEGSVSLSIGAGGRRLVAGERGPRERRPGHRVLGHRYRHRHLARQAADHLRGVPAGGRLDVAQVRRHGPRSRDQPRAVEAARRRNPARQRARRGQHVHAVSADRPCAAREPRAAARAPIEARPAAAPKVAVEPLYVDEARGAEPQRGRRRSRGHPARRSDAPDRRERPRVREGAARGGSRARVQGPRQRDRRGRDLADQGVHADDGVARHLPARHAGLAHPRPAQGRSVDAPHTDLHRLDRRFARPRAVVGRDRLHLEARRVDGSHRSARSPSSRTTSRGRARRSRLRWRRATTSSTCPSAARAGGRSTWSSRRTRAEICEPAAARSARLPRRRVGRDRICSRPTSSRSSSSAR